MAKVNGKSKGNTFERRIANLLSARFKDITGLESAFIRNSDSGSYFGGRNQQRKQTHNLEKATFGDIVCPNDFKFSIECKHYKTSPTFKSVIERKNKQWDDWIKQAEQDAINSNKNVLLIVKYNNVEEVVFIKDNTLSNIILKYNEYSLLTLENLLTLQDSYFFNHGQSN